MNMERWIKRKIVEFLGLADIEMRARTAEASAKACRSHANAMEKLLRKHFAAAVDFSPFGNGNTLIVVASDLNGGTVDVVWANCSDVRRMREITRHLAASIEPRCIIDAPRHVKQALREF